MFKNNTVFVLGAGASWHYGYPTGEGLVENVISMAERLLSHCEWRLKSNLLVQLVPKYIAQKIDQSRGFEGARGGWTTTHDECRLLIDRLKTVRPLIIDYFLAWNETLRPIGKLMISAAILECEAMWLNEQANHNRRATLADAPMKPSAEDVRRIDIRKYRDDWYRFIVHKLVYGCQESADLLKNDVRFITFNYDTSLEYHLFKALMAMDMLKSSDVEKFLADDRIIHVYGSVRSSIPSERDAIDLKVLRLLANALRVL